MLELFRKNQMYYGNSPNSWTAYAHKLGSWNFSLERNIATREGKFKYPNINAYLKSQKVTGGRE